MRCELNGFQIPRFLAGLLAGALLLSISTEAGLGGKKTMYVGGTVTTVKERTEGLSSTNDE